MNAAGSSFYVADGTLRGDARCYVPRQADVDLQAGLAERDFCYVLTSRQMGKSSLMVRTAQTLRQQGVAVVVLDLTAIGQNLTAEQWYGGLLGHLGRQLDLEDELEDFWEAHARVGPLQRWMRALREVVLRQVTKPVTIFVDEIDTVRSLPFSTDEFFAAIRECYNGRSEDPDLARLTFCLLGVATPSDLIRDTRITPFNIGRRIELRDFAEAEAIPLAAGLGRQLDVGKRLLARILHWTGGHPYLTQRLCIAVAEDAGVVGTAGVDRLCEELFLSHRARERDDNLIFVRERILRSEVDRAGLLDRYDRVRRGKKVGDDETSPLVSVLRLSGLTRTQEGNLRIRNRIYAQVFDKEWITSNMPDAELRRQKEAFRRGVVRTALVAAAIFAAVAASIYGYFDAYVWEHRAFFNAYAKRYGVYEGVGPLTNAMVAQRAMSFRFTRVGRFGPVIAMEAVNSAGSLTIQHVEGNYLRGQNDKQAAGAITECRWELVYDRSGRVVYEKAYDWRGQLAWGFVYAPQTRGHDASGHFVGADGYPQSQRHSSADYVQIDYTPEGFERFRRYFDRTDKPQPGPDFAFGHRREFDERGLATRLSVLDAADRPMTNANGVAGETKEFDAHGNPITIAFFDESGKPTRSVNGYAKLTDAYDEFGNWTEERYFDEFGKATRDIRGFAKVAAEYRRGERVAQAFFDESDKPTRHKRGYARMTAKFDAHGNQSELAFFDEKGMPVRNRDGYARILRNHDDRGNRFQEIFFDEAGNPTRSQMGEFSNVAKFDDRGHMIEVRFLDAKGNLCVGGIGCAKTLWKYDERGNILEEAYFDAMDRPTRIKDGFAKMVFSHDERGNRTEEAYFDETGKPTPHKAGNHKNVAKYDDRGNRIEIKFLDEFDQLTPINGRAKIVARYDERNNLIEQSYFGRSGEPVRGNSGNHRYVARFDTHGNRIEASYFDEKGKPVRIDDGYARYTAEYDARGNLIASRYFDETGKPIADRDGDGSWTARYDARDNRIEEAHFDVAGKPRRLKDGSHKWAARFNQLDQQIERAYFDEADKPVKIADGYSSFRAKFDDRRNRVEVAYFDVLGNPAVDKNGDHLWRARFDDRGNEIEMAYFDEAGNPRQHKNGRHSYRTRYDDFGRRTEVAYFDIAGKPVPDALGYCMFRVRHDARGNAIENAYFDGEGKPARHVDGNCKFVAKFDAHDRRIEVAYLDENDRPVCIKDGFAKFTNEFDKFGKWVDSRHFDDKDRLLRMRVVVETVKAGGQGDKLGIKPGDILVRYADKSVSGRSNFFQGRNRERSTDDPRELAIERDGTMMTMSVRPGLLGVVLQERYFPADESVSAKNR